MEHFTTIVTGLRETGLSDTAIAKTLTAQGVKVTQAAISRIRSGEIKHPRYELGNALKLLYAERLAGATNQASAD